MVSCVGWRLVVVQKCSGASGGGLILPKNGMSLVEMVAVYSVAKTTLPLFFANFQ